MIEETVKGAIRTVRDWPVAGVNFRDVTTLFQNVAIFRAAVASLEDRLAHLNPTVVAGVDARGFVLAGVLAHRMGLPLALVRKKGKLPYRTIEEAYELEYGQAVVEIHEDACGKGDRLLVVDDLIATGGTLLAAIRLFRRLEAAVVGAVALVDLPELGGSAKIEAENVPTVTVCKFTEDE
ncbi:MAG: adenine phosphoribosyltransferase [Puniceicoccaceae bacterium]